MAIGHKRATFQKAAYELAGMDAKSPPPLGWIPGVVVGRG